MTLAILFRRAFSDLWQDLGTQFLTTMVVCLSTLMFAFFSLIYFNLQHFVERFGEELGIVIYLKKDVAQERITELYQDLSHLKGVDAVKYVSPEEAFKRLESYLKEEKGVLKGVDPDFLPPSFELRIDRAVFNLDRIRTLADQIKNWPEVAKVQYGQEWLSRLEQFSEIVKYIVIVSGLLLLLTAAFVVSNTIKLTVYARQQELEILRLVGATNGFIQGPFLIESFLQGLVGSGTALGILFLGFRYLTTMLKGTEILRGLEIYFLPWQFTVILVGCSVLFCLFGTTLSMRRFLRL